MDFDATNTVDRAYNEGGVCVVMNESPMSNILLNNGGVG